MSYPEEIRCRVEHRTNVHVPGGTEWALNIALDKVHTWTLRVYRTKPAAKTVQKDLDLILRSFQMYHDVSESNRARFELKNPEITFTE